VRGAQSSIHLENIKALVEAISSLLEVFQVCWGDPDAAISYTTATMYAWYHLLNYVNL